MKYRDNDVYIKATMPGADQVINGHYLVQGHSVAGGQDPDNKIHSGLIASFGRDGRMRFIVGRKGSKGVASWFSGQISAAETTFNHKPDKLNFAFMGQLTLNIERLGTLIFENVALAQGHTLNANNWWFGARGAERTKTANRNWIKLTGTVQGTGSKCELYFLRGESSGTNDIEFAMGFVNPGLASGSPEPKPKEIPVPKPKPGPKVFLGTLEKSKPEPASNSGNPAVEQAKEVLRKFGKLKKSKPEPTSKSVNPAVERAKEILRKFGKGA